MKRLFILIAIFVSFVGYGQQANKLLQSQSKPYLQTPPKGNILGVDTSDFRIWAYNIDSMKLKIWNMLWVMDSMQNFGDGRYAQLLGAYSNPAFVNSLSAAKVFGLSPVALSGAYSDLTGTPNLSLYYLASNPNGYISGVTSGMIAAALGYTPYNGTLNPNNYVSSTSLAASLAAYVLRSDSTAGYVTKYRLDTVVNSIYGLLGSKLNVSGFTAAAINAMYGYTPYNGVANALGFITNSALTGYWLKSDTVGNNYTTQYRLDTIKATLNTSIATKQPQLSGTGFVKINGATISYDNSTYLTSVPAQSFASLTGKPTTLSGYGITDGITFSALTTALSSYVTTSSLTSGLAGKFNQPAGTTLQYIRGDGSLATLNTAVVPENGGNVYYTDVRSRAAISVTTSGSGAATYNNSTGVLNIPTPVTAIPDYYNTVNTVSDSAVFYITSDKTSSGTALYTNITYVNPLVNDLNGNYTFGWTISTDKKKIVVRSKVATNTAVIALLGISLLSSTVAVTTNTQIQLLVKGN